MTGGPTFMLNDKMRTGFVKNEMMCRIDPEIHDDANEQQGCRTMDFSVM